MRLARLTIRSQEAVKRLPPVSGVRPPKRTIQRLLQDPLARRPLEGQFHEGDTVRVDLQGGEITFSRA